MPQAQGRLAGAYQRFRGGKPFFIALVAWIATWLGLHFTMGFDKDLGGYNAVLSTEASIALGFATLAAERWERWMQKELEYMQHLLEAQRAVIEAALAKVDDKC